MGWKCDVINNEVVVIVVIADIYLLLLYVLFVLLLFCDCCFYCPTWKPEGKYAPTGQVTTNSLAS